MTAFSAIDRAAGADPALARALAGELAALAETVEGLLGALGGDPAMLRHVVALQAIDRVAQTQHALAAILRSDAPVAERLDALPLEDLADRLRADYARPELR